MNSTDIHESTSSRDARLNLRTTSAQASLIRRAAEASHKSMTDFVLESATSAAEQVLADRRWFQLTDINWTEFEAILDRPAIHKPRLAALLESEDPFIG
jgi:uncharacterized protein (DUF1778 family)